MSTVSTAARVIRTLRGMPASDGAGVKLTRVIGTHFHPDHVGLAGSLCESHRAPLLMTRGEFAEADRRLTEIIGSGGGEAPSTQRLRRRLAEAGWPKHVFDVRLTVDQDLLDAADILPGELVSIVDVTNGARLETYTIAGERGSGVLGINGAAAHLVHPGDIVILIAYGQMDDDEARNFQPKVVHVDADNRIVELGVDPADGLLDGLSRPPLSREWNEAQAEL